MNLNEWHDWKYNSCDIKESEEKKMEKIKTALKEIGLLVIGLSFYLGFFWFVATICLSA